MNSVRQGKISQVCIASVAAAGYTCSVLHVWTERIKKETPLRKFARYRKVLLSKIYISQRKWPKDIELDQFGSPIMAKGISLGVLLGPVRMPSRSKSAQVERSAQTDSSQSSSTPKAGKPLQSQPSDKSSAATPSSTLTSLAEELSLLASMSLAPSTRTTESTGPRSK